MEAYIKSLTKGNIYKTLIAYAIPFLCANLMQAAYGAVDIAILGWFSDARSLSAAYTGTQFMLLVNSLVSGLTVGGMIQIAQYIGGHKKEDALETMSTMFTFIIGAAILFTSIIIGFMPSILRLLNTPEECYVQTKQYFLISSCGIIFIFGYNGVSAVLRGFGDSTRPFIFIAISSLLNSFLDVIFIGAFKMGAAGAAFATIMSQGLCMNLAIAYLNYHDFMFDFRPSSFKVYKDKAIKLLKLGIPLSLQEALLYGSFLLISGRINAMGVATSAGVGIAEKLESFAMLPTFAFSSALASIVAQNMGRGYKDRALSALNAGIVICFMSSLGFWIWAQLAPASFVGLFTKELSIINASIPYMKSFSYDFLAVTFGYCLLGFFNGCGHTMFTMLNETVSTLLIRLPFAFIISRYMTNELFGIGIADAISTSVCIVISIWYLQTGKWKKMM